MTNRAGARFGVPLLAPLSIRTVGNIEMPYSAHPRQPSSSRQH
jgi:hypothetical protein